METVIKVGEVVPGGVVGVARHNTQERAVGRGGDGHDGQMWTRSAPEGFLDSDREELVLGAPADGWPRDVERALIEEKEELLNGLRKELKTSRSDSRIETETSSLREVIRGLKEEQFRTILAGPPSRELSVHEQVAVAVRLRSAMVGQDEKGRARPAAGQPQDDGRADGREVGDEVKGRRGSKKGRRPRIIGAYKFEIAVPNRMADEEVRQLTDKFLDVIAPRNSALCAIHKDTGKKHVHVLVFPRDSEGKKIHYPKFVPEKERERLQREGKEVPVRYVELDEKWVRIYAEHVGDEKIYSDYIRLKQQTEQHKRENWQARRSGRPIPAKPDRVADHRDQLSERKDSKRASREKVLGRESPPRGPAERLPTTSGREVGRQLAVHELAEVELGALREEGAPRGEILKAGRELEKIKGVLTESLEMRQRKGLAAPPMIITQCEEAQLKDYKQRIAVARTAKREEKALATREPEARAYFARFDESELRVLLNDERLAERMVGGLASAWERTRTSAGLPESDKNSRRLLEVASAVRVESERLAILERDRLAADPRDNWIREVPSRDAEPGRTPAPARTGAELSKAQAEKLGRALGSELYAEVDLAQVRERVRRLEPVGEQRALDALSRKTEAVEKLLKDYGLSRDGQLPDSILKQSEAVRVEGWLRDLPQTLERTGWAERLAGATITPEHTHDRMH